MGQNLTVFPLLDSEDEPTKDLPLGLLQCGEGDVASPLGCLRVFGPHNWCDGRLSCIKAGGDLYTATSLSELASLKTTLASKNGCTLQ